MLNLFFINKKGYNNIILYKLKKTPLHPTQIASVCILLSLATVLLTVTALGVLRTYAPPAIVLRHDEHFQMPVDLRLIRVLPQKLQWYLDGKRRLWKGGRDGVRYVCIYSLITQQFCAKIRPHTLSYSLPVL